MRRFLFILALMLLSSGLSAQIAKPEAVDLGLTVKWADRNVGASSAEDYGDLLAWGETQPKEDYSWMSYRWCEVDYAGGVYYYIFTRYWPGNDYLLPNMHRGKYAYPEGGVVRAQTYWGYVNQDANIELTVLKPSDDAASVAYGPEWRTPTRKEWAELMDNCRFVLVDADGVMGMKVISKKNGNSIYLPFTGQGEGTVSVFQGYNTGYFKHDNGNDRGLRGYYWSSDLYLNDDFYKAYYTESSSTGATAPSKAPCRSAYYFRVTDLGEYDINRMQRFYGHAVRAVYDK